MTYTYWEKDIETIDRRSLQKLQLKQLKETVTAALKTKFYAPRLKSSRDHLSRRILKAWMI